jgi:hypothetical protein
MAAPGKGNMVSRAGFAAVIAVAIEVDPGLCHKLSADSSVSWARGKFAAGNSVGAGATPRMVASPSLLARGAQMEHQSWEVRLQ